MPLLLSALRDTKGDGRIDQSVLLLGKRMDTNLNP